MLEKEKLQELISEFIALGHEPSTRELSAILRKYPKKEGGFYSKSEILEMASSHYKNDSKSLKRIRKLLRLKPTRTISGVAPITIFTKPYPCPGQCIFCPSQEGMPKSYLREEPGAMRGESLKFDPYDQVKLRIKALGNIGHNVEKVEIIISGGTWSFYPKDYRTEFIKEAFKALNDLPKTSRISLEELHRANEEATHRCVGLVIETRPDYIDEEEIEYLRSLGVTKVQLGVQSLNNKILKINKRGHTAEDSQKAINLLRLAGFKIHIHWMANLYQSTPEIDLEDFKLLFSDKSILPDEIKIYPCSVLENTPLYQLMYEGKHVPYTESELVYLLVQCKQKIPQYCRVSRLIRDIPSQLIEGGSKTTNLRQIVQNRMKKMGLACQCIRCREIRNKKFSKEDIRENDFQYETNISTEHFLSFTTGNKIVGFLRLSLPKRQFSEAHFLKELKDAAIIREVHVYGRALEVGKEGESQHLGLGKKLISEAKRIAIAGNYKNLAVISAIGTKQYYRKIGFKNGNLYQQMSIS